MGIVRKKPRTPPWPAHPAWSTSKWWTFLRNKLRSSFSRWPPKYEALREARKDAPKGKRHKYEFQCAICKNWFKQTDVSVDHIVPCGSLRSFDDVGGFVERLFCAKDGLQVLCNKCHKAKTYEERNQKEE